jgi:ATP-dependent Lhr-like helicase
MVQSSYKGFLNGAAAAPNGFGWYNALVECDATMDTSIQLEGPSSAAAALEALSTSVRRWFCRRFCEPTGAQRLAWPAIAGGAHVLVSAPTGTGKTLAAFLPILDAVLTEMPSSSSPWSVFRSGVRCIYVAPLKALVNDICRSLHGYLQDLAEIVPCAPMPTVGVRTGDSPAEERRRFRANPPDILLTTPESLAVLLTQPLCRSLFSELRWVVVDEVHALAPSKRGADLAISLERLSELAKAEIQRIGLSATATPLAETARFLVGTGRCCRVAAVADDSRVEIEVQALPGQGGFISQLIEAVEPHLRRHRATLLFTDTRRLAERLSWGLRRAVPAWADAIAVHHSALAAPRRQEIERAFKRGQLRAIVSSATLELGIDIGPVDLVILVRPPGDVVRFLQRLGRAGHAPGRVKRGLVLTANAAELLEAAVIAASGQAAQCEPLGVADHPLDVLCQHLLAMAALETCFDDDVFSRVRRAYPYRNLARDDFDRCLAYLFGLDRQSLPWLPARLRRDQGGFTIRDRNTARLLRCNLGAIVADEETPVMLKMQAPAEADRWSLDEEGPTYRQVGEVTSAFAERLRPGDRFLLDGRCLECKAPRDGAVIVDEVLGTPVAPVWGGEGWPLSAELAQRLYLMRAQAAELLREGDERLGAFLGGAYGLNGDAVSMVIDYLLRQECVSEVPDHTLCLVEGVAGERATTYYVHTPLNRLGNDALARVLVHRLARDNGRSAMSLVADLGFAVTLSSRREDVPALLRTLLDGPGFAADLGAALADSLALRQRFRRVAETGLMLLRNPLRRRRHVGGRDWAAHTLFDKVSVRDPSFVLLRQAEREVKREVCDLSAARAFLARLPQMGIRCRYLSLPSPFVENWARLAFGPQAVMETPQESLRRLHFELTGSAANR